jgi:hypothetical protein
MQLRQVQAHDGQEVAKGYVLAEWDPFNEPFVCEEEGVIRFTDIIDGKTVQEKVDDITRQASLTIMEYRTTNFRPSISICDEHARHLYGLPRQGWQGAAPCGLPCLPQRTHRI